MSRSNRPATAVGRWQEIEVLLSQEFPNLAAWWGDTTEFVELRLKARDDGTILAVAKGYDSGGGPVVAFGVGYDPILALMAIDATIQGGHWRVDKPWPGKPVRVGPEE